MNKAQDGTGTVADSSGTGITCEGHSDGSGGISQNDTKLQRQAGTDGSGIKADDGTGQVGAQDGTG